MSRRCAIYPYGTVSARPLGLLSPLLLAALVACSSATTPQSGSQPGSQPGTTASVRGQVTVPSAFLPAGTSPADVYAKTRVWLYTSQNTATQSTAVDASGAYTLNVPAGASGQRLVAVIGSGTAAVSFETSLVPLAATTGAGSAHLDITLQSTLDAQYASDPVLRASYDSAANSIWKNAFAAQNIAPIDPGKVPAGALLLTGPDLSGDPSGALLGSQALGSTSLREQGFLDGVGNFFGGVVNGVAGAVQGTVSAVTGGVSYVFNGLKNAIAGVTTQQEPRLIVDYDNSARQLVLTGIGGKVISNDGGSLISNDGGGLISNDGGGIVATGGGNVISNDGGSLTGSGLKAQATTFATTPVGGTARFMGAGERCVSAINQISCVLVGNILTAAVGQQAAAAIADAAMQTGNLRIAYTLGELLDAASKRAALLAAITSGSSSAAPTTVPGSIAASPARASNQRPLASIALKAGSGGSGTVPYTETFDASGSRDPDGSVSLYEWNFGDGNPLLRLVPSSGVKVSHTYTRAGNFTASLTVYDNAGGQSDAALQAITVSTPTALPVIGDPSPATLNLNAPVGGSATASVQYSNLGGGGLNAAAAPGNSWLTVVSNTPSPLAPGATATLTLRATCPASAGVLNTDLLITANDSRIARKSVNVTLNCTAPLPVIGDPSPATLNLAASTGATVTGSFTFSNTGAAPLSADAAPSSGWLSVLSNSPRPLNPGDTATVKLQATCPATATTLSTDLLVTANDSRIPRKTVTVNLTCSAPAAVALGLGVTSVGGQGVPPYGTAANPAVLSGTVSVSGYVQAGGSPVSKVQVLLVGNPYPVTEKAVSVAAGARQDGITEASLDTTQISNGSYSFFVRAVDDSGASADSAPVTVLVRNTAAPTQHPAASEITQIGSAPVAPGQAAVAVGGSVNVFARLYGGSSGYNGNVYLCFQRSGVGNTPVASASANIQASAVYDFGYTWNTGSVTNTPGGGQDGLYLSGSPKCDDVSNPATTSFISVRVNN